MTGGQQQKMAALLESRVKPFVDQHYWLPLYSMGAFATHREEELGLRPTAGNQGRLGACASRYRAGLHSPKVTSPPRVIYPRAVLMQHRIGSWVT